MRSSESNWVLTNYFWNMYISPDEGNHMYLPFAVKIAACTAREKMNSSGHSLTRIFRYNKSNSKVIGEGREVFCGIDWNLWQPYIYIYEGAINFNYIYIIYIWRLTMTYLPCINEQSSSCQSYFSSQLWSIPSRVFRFF